MKIILVLLPLSLLVEFLICTICDRDDTLQRAVKIKFSQFEKWYEIAPQHWDLGAKYVHRIDIPQTIRFSLFDSLRYRIWRRGLKKRKQTEQEMRDLEQVLIAVQRDIDNVRRQGELELKKAKLMMEKITHL